MESLAIRIKQSRELKGLSQRQLADKFDGFVKQVYIFNLQAIASLSAGWFVFNFGWEVVLLSVVPLLILQLTLLLWWQRVKD